MYIPEGDIRFACMRYGAKAVLDAANKRLAGELTALQAVGLPAEATFDEADHVGRVAYRTMSASERNAVIAESAAGSRRDFASSSLHGPL